jgi:hypothetical protein
MHLEGNAWNVHRNDLYKFMESQPSGFDLISSGAAPLGLDSSVFVTAPFLARFFAEAAVDGALRLTPDVGLDLPLVAGDIEN